MSFKINNKTKPSFEKKKQNSKLFNLKDFEIFKIFKIFKKEKHSILQFLQTVEKKKILHYLDKQMIKKKKKTNFTLKNCIAKREVEQNRVPDLVHVLLRLTQLKCQIMLILLFVCAQNSKTNRNSTTLTIKKRNDTFKTRHAYLKYKILIRSSQVCACAFDKTICLEFADPNEVFLLFLAESC